MSTIDIKITFQCNNNCIFCVQGDKRSICGDKEKSEIIRILHNSKGNFNQVVFTGGECSLREDLIELVQCAKKLGYEINIQSNGRMFFYKDFCKEIVVAGAKIFSFSLHGHTKDLHESLTRIKGSFNQTVKGLDNLLKLGACISTNTVIVKPNYRYLADISIFLMSLGIDQYQLAYPHILGNVLTNKSDLIVRKKQIMPFVIKAIDVGLKNNARPYVEAIPYCFLPGYEICISDRYIPDTKVFEWNFVNDFTRWRKDEGKIKGPQCSKCKYFDICEGPWREYPELYGWSEFKPIEK